MSKIVTMSPDEDEKNEHHEEDETDHETKISSTNENGADRRLKHSSNVDGR